MQEGRELDRLVAEKVMGWQWTPRNSVFYPPVFYPPNLHPLSNIFGHDVPKFSTDIAASWEVVEKLRKDEHYVDVKGYDEEHIPVWKCVVHHWNGFQYEAKSEDTPYLAICMAALKAVGYKEDQS